jgi:glycosyltransferase involved in cell wall biosynthesis
MAKGGIRNWFWKKFQPTIWYTPIKGAPERPADDNAVHVCFPIETPADVSSRSYMRGGKVRLICVGRYGMARKRLKLLLEAVNMLKDSHDFTLTIIGTGRAEKSGYKQLASYVRENGLDSIVTLKLNLAFKEVLEEYARHDLYVLPSVDEPYSGSILEAMSRGLGVICTETNQAKDLIDERTGAVCRPDDVDDLRRKLASFLAEPERVERAGRAAGEIAATRHHPDVFHQSFVRMIERAIGGKVAEAVSSQADHGCRSDDAVHSEASRSPTGFPPARE